MIRRFFSQVDAASMVLFRIGFGLLMVWEVWKFFNHGWIDYHWGPDRFHFQYSGFSWIHPWPGDGIYLHVFLLGLFAFFVAIGFCYRLSATLLFFLFSYLFLIEKSRYLNHFYLIALISFLMIFVPAHRSFSIDSWLSPKLRSSLIPLWSLWIIRLQIAVPYFFGGLAKINHDWLRGKPLDEWLPARDHFFLIGHLFHEDWMIYLFSYGGMFFDLLVVPLLIWRKTRPFAFFFVLVFNLTNFMLFNIGVFPWFMIAATTLFFEPDWPKRLLGIKGAVSLPAPQHLRLKQKIGMVCLVGFFSFQCLLPLRHFLYPGVVHWTEEGHNFSWHMKLRDKDGEISFRIVDPTTGLETVVNPRRMLTSRQVRKMSTRPDMILQFAHHLASFFPGKVEVYADSEARLNGREWQTFIDPDVDLTKHNRSFWPAPYITPLNP